MKTGLLILLSLFIVSSLCAFDQGTINPGGSVSFSSFKENSDADAYSEFSIFPQVGYFFMENLSGDVMLAFSSSKEGDYKFSTFGLGLGARYFYNNFYGGAGFIMSSYTDSQTGFPDFKVTSNYLNLKAGYVVPVAENVFVDLGLKYQMGFGKYGGDITVDNEESLLNFGAGLQIFFPMNK
jgi:hypothetical protein